MNHSMSRRAFLQTLMLGGVGAVLSACGGSAPQTGDATNTNSTNTNSTNTNTSSGTASQATSAPAAAGGTINLRFGILSGEDEKKNAEAMVAAYNKLYPNVSVSIEQLGSDQYFQKLQLDATSGTIADVFWIHDQGTKQYAEKGLMLNLNDYMGMNSFFKKDDVYPSMLQLGQYNQGQYMMPRDYNHLVTFYNRTAFKDAGVPEPKDGWTWQEMVDAATKLTKKDASGNVSMYGIDGSNFSWWAMAVPAIRGYGGEVVDESGKVVVDSDQAAAGIDALYQLVKSGAATNFAEKPSDTFNTAKCAMLFHVRPLVSSIWEAAKDKWEPAVVTFPKFAVKGAVGTGTSGYAAYAKTKNPNEAAALALFIASTEGQKAFNSTGNAVPVLQSLAQDPSWTTVPSASVNQKAFVEFPENDSLPVETRIPAGAAGPYDTSRTELMEQVFLGKMTAREMVTEWGKRLSTAIQEAS